MPTCSNVKRSSAISLPFQGGAPLRPPSFPKHARLFSPLPLPLGHEPAFTRGIPRCAKFFPPPPDQVPHTRLRPVVIIGDHADSPEARGGLQQRKDARSVCAAVRTIRLPVPIGKLLPTCGICTSKLNHLSAACISCKITSFRFRR